MKQSIKLKWLAPLGVLLLLTQAFAEEPQELKTPEEMMNYSIGVELVRNIRKQGMEINLDLVIKGIKDAAAGEKLLLSDKLIKKSMNSFQAELRKKQRQQNKLTAEANKKEGAAFLAENKTKEGVVTLKSGVQYKVIRMGEGKKPTDTDTVVCNYRGSFVNGTEFDSTDPGEPATLKVNQLIAGWKEALKLMPEGSKWQIFIPYQLAYGARGAGSDIGPNSTLIFEVELLSVK